MKMNIILSLLIGLACLSSCDKNDDKLNVSFNENSVQLSTHKLETYNVETNSKYLIIFESGLGDDHSVWQSNNVAEKISKKMDVVLYDRGGYGKSTVDNNPRNIERLRSELEQVIDKYANGRKVILVGHSLGGLIIRDYAIKNPGRIAGLLFVDPSHENYNQPSQSVEDLIYNSFSSSYGVNFGGTKEVRELIEDFAYTSLLPNLPNVPVIVLTSMKQDQANKTSDETYNKTREDWYNAHDQLKNGVTDFTHIQTTKSGHYIMKEEPDLIVNNIDLLIARIK